MVRHCVHMQRPELSELSPGAIGGSTVNSLQSSPSSNLTPVASLPSAITALAGRRRDFFLTIFRPEAAKAPEQKVHIGQEEHVAHAQHFVSANAN